MDGDRFVVSARENPRTLGLGPERGPGGSATATAKPMSSEISQSHWSRSSTDSRLC
ncbi:hypothetical protein CK203_014865 [Vitis vinifera]|uniref:Uncharacterized protein n=1 Tax=Vitis vinifera TaxID=29760 RepID=A0A438JG30_VITVI|nr:hypothetical protein CK203_014865 [Vitis vinifera]